MRFETISSLKINLEKSKLILIGDMNNMKKLVSMLRC